MSKYTYYVYEYCSGKLGCLNLVKEISLLDFIYAHNLITLQYEFKDKVFETLNEFLSYLNLLNASAAVAYVEDIVINPPYTIRKELRGSEISTNK